METLKYVQTAATVVALMILLVSGAAISYSMSILTGPLEREFNATRAEVSYVMSFQLTSVFFMAMPSALAFKAIPVFRLLLIGSLAMICGTVSTSFCTSLWQANCLLGFMSGSGAGILYAIAQFSIPHFWPDSVSTYTGIVFSGVGTGGVIWSNMLGSIAETQGWRVALRTTGLVTGSFLLFPLVFIGYCTDVGVGHKTLDDDRCAAVLQKPKLSPSKVLKTETGDRPYGSMTSSTHKRVGKGVRLQRPSLLDTLKRPSLLTITFSFLLYGIASTGCVIQ